MDQKKNIESLYNEMSNLYGEMSEINDSITIPDGSILEFFHSYSIPETYVTKSLVTQYRMVAEDPEKNKFSLADIYYLSNNVILDDYVSSIFSKIVKFTSYQLKVYDPSNLSTPIFLTKKEYIPGIYGKLLDEPYLDKSFRVTLKLKSSSSADSMPTLWYRDLYLQGIPKSLETWDDPELIDDKPLEALRKFIKAFSMLKLKGLGLSK